jgi:hypothetical protein
VNKESNPFLLLGRQARRSCFHQARTLADGGGICTPMAWQIWNHFTCEGAGAEQMIDRFRRLFA